MTSEQKQICKEIIRKAGHRLLEMHSFGIEEKTDFKNLVTSCDKDIQDYLMKELHQAVPDATFLCEENGETDISGQTFFVIDPIDGTSNFIHDYKLSVISVAYADHEKVIWGMVYNPYMEEFFEGELGKGAYLNDKPIHVRREPLEKCLVNFGTAPYYDDLRKESFALAEQVIQHCVDLRRTGSAAIDYCYTACGRCGLYFERLTQPWDFAAGIRIAMEAGAVVYNYDYEIPDHTKSTSAVAGSPENVERFFEIYEAFCKDYFHKK